jgi:hypothetical protein
MSYLTQGLNDQSVKIIRNTTNGKLEFRLSLLLRQKIAKLLEEPVTIASANDYSKLNGIEFARVFVELFPNIARNGTPFRSDAMNVDKQFMSFSRKYKYSRALIVQATTKYLAEQALNNYAYCKTALNLILSFNLSTLADLCATYAPSTESNPFAPTTSVITTDTQPENNLDIYD